MLIHQKIQFSRMIFFSTLECHCLHVTFMSTLKLISEKNEISSKILNNMH